MRHIPLILCIFLCLPLLSSARPLPSRQSRNAYLRAVKSSVAGQQVQAIRQFEALIPRYREECGQVSAPLAKLYGSLGFARLKAADRTGAEQAFRQSLTIFEALHGPRHGASVDPLRGLAMCAEQRKDWPGAATVYQRCTECLYEDDVHSLPTLADILERYGRVLRRMPAETTWFGMAGRSSARMAEMIEKRAKAIRRRVEAQRR